jgi:hypothetical protein
MTFASLSEAVSWLEDHWAEQRPVPMRLHTHSNEGLGPFYSGQFQAALSGNPEAVVTMTGPTACYHPLLGLGMRAIDCPECFGLGVKEHRTDRYLYPMSRALTHLRNSLGSPRQPHPYALVILLALCQFDARRMHRMLDEGDYSWNRTEAYTLMALRKLRGWYVAGPTPTHTSAPSWVDKSESQRTAETMA